MTTKRFSTNASYYYGGTDQSDLINIYINPKENPNDNVRMRKVFETISSALRSKKQRRTTSASMGRNYANSSFTLGCTEKGIANNPNITMTEPFSTTTNIKISRTVSHSDKKQQSKSRPGEAANKRASPLLLKKTGNHTMNGIKVPIRKNIFNFNIHS